MVSFATKHEDPKAKLGWNERLGYGTAGFGINALNGIIGSFLTIYFTNVAFLDAGIIATLIAVSKVFDGVSDLIIGRLVDRTKSSMGKARVWLVRMCLPFALTTLLLFFVPAGFPNMLKYVYVFLMYNIVNTICLTSMMVPFFTMVSLITEDSYERGLLGNIQQIFQTLGNVFVNSMFVVLLTKFSESTETIYTQRSFTLAMLVFCIIMVATSLITVLFSKERVKDDGMQGQGAKGEENTVENVKSLLTNKYWLMLILGNFVIFFVVIFNAVGSIYYSQYVFGNPNSYSWMSNSISIAQFAIMLVTPVLMKIMPKHSIYTMGMGIMAVGYLGFAFWGNTQATMICFNALKGIGLGISGAMALGLIADSIEYGRLKTGTDAIGMGNAGMSAAQKLGLGLGTAVFGWILSGSGFDPTLDLQGTAQPQSVITAIQFVYNWIPFALVLLVFLMMFIFYRNVEKDIAKMRTQKGE